MEKRPQLQQSLAFTASGTNRSLRQRVVIRDTLDLDGAAPASDAVAPASR